MQSKNILYYFVSFETIGFVISIAYKSRTFFRNALQAKVRKEKKGWESAAFAR